MPNDRTPVTRAFRIDRDVRNCLNDLGDAILIRENEVQMIAWITANWQIVSIGAALLYALLPANSPIKAFLNKIIGGILPPQPTPGPTPVPGPGPAPVPVPIPIGPAGLDWQALLQLLMNVLLKAKSSGDAKTMDSVLAVMDSVKAEHDAAIKSAAPAPQTVRYYYPPQS
jgi:hypothetical protein